MYIFIYIYIYLSTIDICIYSTKIPPIMIINRIYITRLASPEIFSPSNKMYREVVGLRTYQHPCICHLYQTNIDECTHILLNDTLLTFYVTQACFNPLGAIFRDYN